MLAVVLLLLACIETGVTQKDDDIGATETGLDTGGVCFVDTAAPTDCDDVTGDLPEEVATNDDCEHDIESGELDAQVEWSMPIFADYAEFSDVVMAPVVGQMTDDDGDGDIDRSDIPDIVVISDSADPTASEPKQGVLRLISGDGSALHWTVFRKDLDSGAQIYPYRYSNVALGDIDGDLEPEIVALVYVLEGSGNDDGGGDDGGGTDSAPPDSGGSDDGGDGGGDGGLDTGTPIDPLPPIEGPPMEGEEAPPGECSLAAFDHDGNVEWVADDIQMDCGGHAPALADLDGDGDVEVVLGNMIVAGATGALQSQGSDGEGRYTAYREIGMHTIVIDLDGDGQQEIIAGRTLYDASGSVICDTGEDDGFSAAADLDGDGQGEWVVIGNGMARVFEFDCSKSAEWTLLGDGNGGPPTIGDFDADGDPEIGVAEATTYSVYEADGTTLWSTPINDASSHATGSVVFDFEGDSQPEVVFGDEDTLWVFNGKTGAVRLQDTNHESRTLHEFPTVVDVDGDGESEIIVTNGGSHYDAQAGGIYVLGSKSSAWLGTRQVWNQHAYNIVNVEDLLTVPSSPAPNWPDHNNFRSGDPNPATGGKSSDAVPMATTCELECEEDRYVLRMNIGNSGAGRMRPGVPISVYAVVGDNRVLLDTVFTEDALPPGAVSETFTLEYDVSRLPYGVVEIVADDDDGGERVRECDEDNNTLQVTFSCP